MATAQPSLFDTLPGPTRPPAAPPVAALQRWWRLQGQARRRGRRVEPLLVTPRFLSRIDTPVCPVARTPIGPRAGVVVALREDASVAAGHLVTLGAQAAALPEGRWQDAWAEAQRLQAAAEPARTGGLDATAWRRLALLRSFVQAPSPAEAATLPLHVLPPNRLRVLSPVQGLQVAMTLALLGADRATRLSRLAALARDDDTRLALRVCVLTLLARRPPDLEQRSPVDARHALEDLWADPLLQRRWQRLALRLTDAEADALLQRARRAGCLGDGWRPLDLGQAVDGWDAPARPPAAPAESVDAPPCNPVAAALAAPPVAAPVLAAMPRRHGPDAVAAPAIVA